MASLSKSLPWFRGLPGDFVVLRKVERLFLPRRNHSHPTARFARPPRVGNPFRVGCFNYAH
jgi:hypothetical protein